MLASRNETPSTPVQQSDLVNFDDAEMQLNIKDSRITVDKFHFASHDLGIDATGHLGFDKSIAASGNLTVPMDKAKQNRKLSRFVAILPDSMDRISLDFSLSGYLSNIQFNAEPSANLLKGILDQGGDLLHGLGNALKGPLGGGH